MCSVFCVRKQVKLLDLDLCASFLELGGDLLGFVLGDAFLEVLRSAVDEFLGFLQAQAGQSTDDLDDSDLVGASGLQNDVELSLLYLSSSSAGSGSSDSSGSGGNAEFLFQSVDQLSQFQNGKSLNFFDHSSNLFGCHCSYLQ